MFRIAVALCVALLCVSPCFAQTEAPPAQLLSQAQLTELMPFGEKVLDFAQGETLFQPHDLSSAPYALQFVKMTWGRGRRWKPTDYRPYMTEAQRNAPAEWIEVMIMLYASHEKAETAFRKWDRGSGIGDGPTEAGLVLGEMFACNSNGQVLRFLRGRVLVQVSAFVKVPERTAQEYKELRRRGIIDADALMTEAVARSVEYHLCANSAITDATPDVVVRLSNTPNASSALVIGGKAWATLDALKSLGVQSARGADGSVTLSYKQQALIVSPLSRTAQQDKHSFDLGLPILLQDGQVVVPITPIAKRLRLPLPAALR